MCIDYQLLSVICNLSPVVGYLTSDNLLSCPFPPAPRFSFQLIELTTNSRHEVSYARMSRGDTFTGIFCMRLEFGGHSCSLPIRATQRKIFREL